MPERTIFEGTWADAQNTDESVVCERIDQFLLHPRFANLFYGCAYANNEGDLKPVLMPCPAGLVFNPETNKCDWTKNVGLDTQV